MAARVSWGADKHLVVAFGGLHPQYPPPPGFPALRRLTIAFGRGDNPRLTIQAYLAVTPNSRQIGARVELYAAAAGFNIYGWLAFDAFLSVFPFAFTANLSAGVALRRGTRTIAGVHLTATLTGPLPMHAKGRACLSLFFFDICVPFDVTVGEALAAIVAKLDPWPLLRAAVADVRNWSSALLPGVAAVASVAAPRGTAPGVLVEPMGALTLRQTVVPLNRTIERLGEHPLDGPTTFTVESVTVGDDPDGVAWVRTPRITSLRATSIPCPTPRSSHAPPSSCMDAGVTLGGPPSSMGATLGIEVVFETILVDEPWEPPRPAPALPPCPHPPARRRRTRCRRPRRPLHHRARPLRTPPGPPTPRRPRRRPLRRRLRRRPRRPARHRRPGRQRCRPRRSSPSRGHPPRGPWPFPGDGAARAGGRVSHRHRGRRNARRRRAGAVR